MRQRSQKCQASLLWRMEELPDDGNLRPEPIRASGLGRGFQSRRSPQGLGWGWRTPTEESSGSPKGNSYSLHAVRHFLQRSSLLNVSGEKCDHSTRTCDGDGEPDDAPKWPAEMVLGTGACSLNDEAVAAVLCPALFCVFLTYWKLFTVANGR